MDIKYLFPKRLRDLKHLVYAWYGAIKYRHPSRELLVIGVTGTSGKSTTIFLLRQLLEAAGYKVGSLSTIDFYINGKNKLNDQKMTMLGKTQSQKYLREMADAGCQIAIVETTSEGQLQYRNRYIDYDLMILTNLYTEHIEAHGGFEKYKKAKLKIFKRASTYHYGKKDARQSGFQQIAKKYCRKMPKMSLINGDSEYADEFLESGIFYKQYTFQRSNATHSQATKLFQAREVIANEAGLDFTLQDHKFQAPLYGEHNVMNILAAISVGRILLIDWPILQEAVKKFQNAPGRTEFIPEAEKYGFKVIVDYAFEPGAMAGLYSVVDLLKPKKIIHVFGSTGGGRDVARRFTVGEYVGKRADICIITNEDPYDDDPMKIIEDVASAVVKVGKVESRDLFKILDRREAIAKAMQMAEAGDLVMVTGKGSEQAICVAGGKKILWDDRVVVREVLNKI